MYRNKYTIFTYVIFGLMVIGLLHKVWDNFWSLIIPIVVFGGVYLLYKFPPNGRRSPYRNPRAGGYGAKHKTKPRRNNAMFRVIKGNKRDDDDPPPYH